MSTYAILIKNVRHDEEQDGMKLFLDFEELILAEARPEHASVEIVHLSGESQTSSALEAKFREFCRSAKT